MIAKDGTYVHVTRLKRNSPCKLETVNICDVFVIMNKKHFQIPTIVSKVTKL